ncbi:hypothetical protein [Campylobacter sp.]|uniref:hypothetical protein n=1 Tax=Campylobacter sp. TaxID=205 RepID=UPI002AA72A69|nr:hypothetical protein [Campylobacter sp.]MCI7075659.1 hypothetical protein [Campylobacter sp.]
MAQLIGKNCFLGRELASEWGLCEYYFENAASRINRHGSWYYNFQVRLIEGIAFVKLNERLKNATLNKNLTGIKIDPKLGRDGFDKIFKLSDDVEIGFYGV